jgi:hypothetical protein
MATYYGDHFAEQNATDTVGSAAITAGHRVPVGAGHGRLRYKRMFANVPAAMAANDTIILGSFRSADRVTKIHVTHDDLSAGAATWALGIYVSGVAHNGVVVDADVFQNDGDAAAVLSRIDLFEGHALTDLDRGKTLHTICGVADDPVLQYDLVFELLTGPATIGGSLMVEAEYTAGD